MRPSRPSTGRSDLFRERLDAIINPRHPLVRLAQVVPWERFDEAFGGFFKPVGRKAKPTRLMVGLHYLKHLYDLSDDEVVERWVENPYWQYFCGFEFFQHEPLIDASTMTRWRKRIGPQGMEEVLKATVEAVLQTGTVAPSSLERVSVDTTVQSKAIAHPTDSRLYLRVPWKPWSAKRSATASSCGRATPAWASRRPSRQAATPMPGSFVGVVTLTMAGEREGDGREWRDERT